VQEEIKLLNYGVFNFVILFYNQNYFNYYYKYSINIIIVRIAVFDKVFLNKYSLKYIVYSYLI
jgi:hypothetical protein